MRTTDEQEPDPVLRPVRVGWCGRCVKARHLREQQPLMAQGRGRLTRGHRPGSGLLVLARRPI
jgi:hypothetical protein